MRRYPFTCGNAMSGPCGMCADCEREGVVSTVSPTVLKKLAEGQQPKENWYARELRLHREADARPQPCAEVPMP